MRPTTRPRRGVRSAGFRPESRSASHRPRGPRATSREAPFRVARSEDGGPLGRHADPCAGRPPPPKSRGRSTGRKERRKVPAATRRRTIGSIGVIRTTNARDLPAAPLALPPCQRLPGAPSRGPAQMACPTGGNVAGTRAPACPPPLGPAVASHRAPGEVPSRGAAPTGGRRSARGPRHRGSIGRPATMAKQLCFDSDARDALKSGVTKLARAAEEHPRPPRAAAP
jgi:hypothetical protein